ncbi:hypothetical protein AGMMS49992_32810 [Clostridia bacterium]|nr:hypothetical protein AGMMS49992_32810 [Clostridia bacterium]
MKETVDRSLFHSRFHDYGRDDQFSGAGLDALYEYLTDLEEDCGQEIELDVVGLCCDYTEFTSDELIEEYGYLVPDEYSLGDDYMDYYEKLLEELRDRTLIIGFDNGDKQSYLVQIF